jgi:hypothetical protein
MTATVTMAIVGKGVVVVGLKSEPVAVAVATARTGNNQQRAAKTAVAAAVASAVATAGAANNQQRAAKTVAAVAEVATAGADNNQQRAAKTAAAAMATVEKTTNKEQLK